MVRGVFDAILFWECEVCGTLWNRFDPGDYRYERAEKEMQIHETEARRTPVVPLHDD